MTDLNTGLMWQQDPGYKMTFAEAKAAAGSFALAGYSDWRLPSIKELYSLIDFRGSTGTTAATSVPYIDTRYFVFNYGDESIGERFIDSQRCTSTEYVSTTMNGSHTDFGVNFADGRIKGYGTTSPFPGGADKTFYCIYVRGNADYGHNDFADNGDGTISDRATGLMWTEDDSGAFGVGLGGSGKLNWEQALDWAEDLTHAGYSDWRLPNVKELHSIVDYTRSPDTTSSAAIDPIFGATGMTNEGGQADFGCYWSGTTHEDGPWPAVQASYVAFGRALGYMFGSWLDVHGAGAQRGDPKSGNPEAFPYGRGPQGDAIRIYNFARAVRDDSGGSTSAPTLDWVSTAGYESDGVDPDTGDPDTTTFTFKVKYTDADGDVPTKSTCNIRKMATNGTWQAYKSVTLTAESGTPEAGQVYSSGLTLPSGQWQYGFAFASADGDATGAPTEYKDGPTLSGTAVLSWPRKRGYEDGVYPDSGVRRSPFYFRVIYTDTAGDAPTVALVEVNCDGQLYKTATMRAASSDYVKGVTHRRRLRLKKLGTYEYRFRFADASGWATGEPSEWQSGPTVTDITTDTDTGTVATLQLAQKTSGTEMTFDLLNDAMVTATVYDLTGRAVRTVADMATLEAGVNSLDWDQLDDAGTPVAAGQYIIRVEAMADGEPDSSKLVLVDVP